MSYSPADLEAIAKKLRMDLTNAQGKLTDLMNGIAELATKLPDDGHGYLCPRCGLKFPTTPKLTDHRRNVHSEDVPLPAEEAA